MTYETRHFRRLGSFCRATSRKQLIVILLLSFCVALSTFAGCGCGGDSQSKSEDLRDFTNKLSLQFNGSMTVAMVKGTIVKTEKEPNRTFAKVKVTKAQALPGPSEVKNQTIIPTGTEVVIEIRNPKSEFPEGKEIRAILRIVKTEGGYKIFAENAQII